MFVLQVTGIDWQPSGILTRGLDSLRGAMPGRQAIGRREERRGSLLLCLPLMHTTHLLF